jgi:uncharacterized protein
MFGFSFAKLLLTAAVIAAVWYGFKWISRLDQQRKREVGRDSGTDNGGEKAVDGPEDMVACGVCGVYVAAKGARSCGREDCPYPA